VRLCLLKAHYRQDVEYDARGFPRAQQEYGRMRDAIRAAQAASGRGTGGQVDAIVRQARDDFRQAMDDDLNTPAAIASLLRLTKALAGLSDLSSDEGRAIVNVYRETGQILGLFAGLTL